MNQTVVKIENLVKRYKDVLALDHFNLEIEEGEVFGLLGPNGSGKTTTINCLLSLLTYDKGTIEVFGKPMRPDSYALKRNIGVVMQNVAVFEELTVYENIDYFCGLEGIQELNARGATIIYTSHYMEEVEQICTRISIMDKGKNLAIGTNDELKKMIKNSENIIIDIYNYDDALLEGLRQLKHVYSVSANDHQVVIKCSGGNHNLIHVLDYLQSKEARFGKVYSELPTLNDVFLEITGKELRD